MLFIQKRQVHNYDEMRYGLILEKSLADDELYHNELKRGKKSILIGQWFSFGDFHSLCFGDM